MDQLRAHTRSQGLAYKTDQTCVHWVVQFIRFPNKRHPGEMEATAVEWFLSHLALTRDVAKGTQR